ncbi:helix-turn-helix domain-containing protein [Amycolatopsis sp. H20-H5]|uniref:helix-turn-helix domain-containing protein n=1 Tax=Amycolatopsis sp. H20-H5 TaxID=3046309 RepID=UPI002DBD65E9|nr:helix-turn-helix transcriptional regulator [Amycolatopsis sp. H20-H5]MEC3976735.1 helix-turn-helix transcriptional regulator [Amycolatopsis sp. H20-H5]
MTEESTVRRRELGKELRNLRERKHLSGMELSRRVGVLQSKISRWENGFREMTTVDAALYLGGCGVDETERLRLLELTKPPSELYWVRPYFDQLSDPMKSIILQESLANRIVSYEPLVVSGLHQSEAYARSMFEWRGSVAADRVDLLVKARMDRQNVLKRPKAPQGTFYIHERALRSVVGSPRIMQEQILLLILSSTLPHCSIQVVLDSAGPYGTIGGDFTILEFTDHPATVYAAVFGGTIFIDDRPCVDAYYDLVAKLELDALSRGHSREWLVRLADEYDHMEE